MADDSETLITLTADIVSAHVSNNNVAVGDLPALIQNIHGALNGLGTAAEPAEAERKPAVSVRASVKPDHIVCLEDGQKMKMLKRHLATDHQMTPAEYRARWNLPKDYPMVAPDYSARRKELAVKIGLGRKKAAPPTTKPRGRPKAKAVAAAAE